MQMNYAIMIESRVIHTASKWVHMYKHVLMTLNMVMPKSKMNDKAWHLYQRPKVIRRICLLNGWFLVKWPCFKIYLFC